MFVIITRLYIYVPDKRFLQNALKTDRTLKTAHSVISIINLINKKSFTSMDFPDLHFILSEQPYSSFGIAMQTDNQSLEELTKLALFDAQSKIRSHSAAQEWSHFS